MRLDCGPTVEERERLKHERLTRWHRRFAWWPVRVGPRDCRWLEWIERKGTLHTITHWTGSEWWEWQFRALS